MAARIIDGNKVADGIIADVKAEAAKLKAAGREPHISELLPDHERLVGGPTQPLLGAPGSNRQHRPIDVADADPRRAR